MELSGSRCGQYHWTEFAFHSSVLHKINLLHNLLLLFSLRFFLFNFSDILLKKPRIQLCQTLLQYR